MKHPAKNHLRLSERREEAKVRNKKWASMTSEEKLEELDKRLGKDQGAKKQRKKLASRTAEHDETGNKKK